MPTLDRIKDKLATDPKFVTEADFALANECLAFCMTHMEDHRYLPTCVWLNDEQYIQYTSLYPTPTSNPTFFGLPVKANKSA